MTTEPLRTQPLSVRSITLERDDFIPGAIAWTAVLGNGDDELTCTGHGHCPFGFPMNVLMTLEAIT